MIWLRLLLVCLLAFVLVVLVMPIVIPLLHRLKFGQVEREEGLESHKSKNGTPTMGGIVFIIAGILSVYICNIDFIFNPYVNLLAYTFLGYGLIGFIDDYLIVVKHNNEGLKPWLKYALQSLLAVGFIYLSHRFIPDFSTTIHLPISNSSIDFKWFYYIFVYFMFTAESNAVNLTDGLDGLATGLMIIALLPFALFALKSNQAVSIFILGIVGGLLGFLYFNANPAQIFMGDSGSLALGALLAAVAFMTKQELLLLVIGIVPLIETLSVIIQVVSFKTRGKRIFKMAPLHHHFEMSGWSEVRVVFVFWLCGIVAGIAGFMMGVL